MVIPLTTAITTFATISTTSTFTGRVAATHVCVGLMVAPTKGDVFRYISKVFPRNNNMKRRATSPGEASTYKICEWKIFRFICHAQAVASMYFLLSYSAEMFYSHTLNHQCDSRAAREQTNCIHYIDFFFLIILQFLPLFRLWWYTIAPSARRSSFHLQESFPFRRSWSYLLLSLLFNLIMQSSVPCFCFSLLGP